MKSIKKQFQRRISSSRLKYLYLLFYCQKGCSICDKSLEIEERSFGSKRSDRTEIQWRVCFVNFDGSWCSRLRFSVSFLSLFMGMSESILIQLTTVAFQTITHSLFMITFPFHVTICCVQTYELLNIPCIFNQKLSLKYDSYRNKQWPVLIQFDGPLDSDTALARSRRQRTQSCPRDRLDSQRASSTHC